ncbi:hypothetical protein A3196_06580 [Candidatus Thiodiazotropha endoloripes]|uniref:Uncharacterized protein n=1 Tax=Candidatus Thiodiazotropha endoloripes TaxID=1818881 RepID=A0A1E2UPH6_9GAMM|nr:hypothetical protein A3196_06580 [Candidatus Thiodiazotropha endoloripes]
MDMNRPFQRFRSQQLKREFLEPVNTNPIGPSGSLGLPFGTDIVLSQQLEEVPVTGFQAADYSSGGKA